MFELFIIKDVVDDFENIETTLIKSDNLPSGKDIVEYLNNGYSVEIWLDLQPLNDYIDPDGLFQTDSDGFAMPIKF